LNLKACPFAWSQSLVPGTNIISVNPYPDLTAVSMSIFNSSNDSTVLSTAKDMQLSDSIITTEGVLTLAPAPWATASESRLRTVRCIHNRLRATIPERIDCKLLVGNEEMRKLIKLDGNFQFFSLAAYLVSNNMLDIGKASAMTNLFQGERNRRFLRSLLSIRSPTIEAFAEKLFLGATKCRDAGVMQECLNAGVDPESCLLGRTALQYVATYGGMKLSQLLVSAGADINAPPRDESEYRLNEKRTTALQAAAENGNIELVLYLVSVGADVNALPARYFGKTSLQAASKNGSIKLLQLLITAGADVNAPAAHYGGRTAVQEAVENGNVELVQYLLAAGAEVNAPKAHTSGKTALQAAAKIGDVDLVRILLEAGADINPPSDTLDEETTTLQAAVKSGSIELVQYLVAAGANVNPPPASSPWARTALQLAAQSGSTELVQILLDAGADVDGCGASNEGRTALEGAAEHGRIDMVQLLLNAGAEVHGHGEKQYRNAVNLASKYGHNAIRRILEAKYESDMSLAQYRSEITSVYCQW
jgi:ankyrin repeat protein